MLILVSVVDFDLYVQEYSSESRINSLGGGGGGGGGLPPPHLHFRHSLGGVWGVSPHLTIILSG